MQNGHNLIKNNLAENLNHTAIKALEIEIKLHINNSLYDKGLITKEMYQKAKEKIISD